MESSEGDKSPVLTFERAATHSNNPPGWGWRMEWLRGGGVQGGSEHFQVWTLPSRKNSGVAEEDKTGKMKRGGPTSGFVSALVAITALFLSLS